MPSYSAYEAPPPLPNRKDLLTIAMSTVEELERVGIKSVTGAAVLALASEVHPAVGFVAVEIAESDALRRAVERKSPKITYPSPRTGTLFSWAIQPMQIVARGVPAVVWSKWQGDKVRIAPRDTEDDIRAYLGMHPEW